MTVLFTGFDPFGGEDKNASYEAVKKLPAEIDGALILTAEIPTEYKRSFEVLKELIAEEKPDAVICVGQAAGRSGITPEKVAINFADARIEDNAGCQPHDKPLIEGGETAYFSTLPVREITDAINAADIPASVSYSAGTFVCNSISYKLLKLTNEEYPWIRAGFIHVPLTPDQVSEARPLPSLPLEKITQALLIAAKVIIKKIREEE